GTIAPGTHNGRDITILDVYEGIGSFAAHRIDLAELKALEDAACPGAGACGGQFTANTMATALEFLGISPAGLNGIPATHPEKLEAAECAGRLVMDLVRANRRPSEIMTKEAVENAITAISATGGSTNGVLHMLAIARELDVPLTIDDFHEVAQRTPVIASLSPGGRFVATDLYEAGGLSVVARELVKHGLVHEDSPNVDGRRLGDYAAAAQEREGQEVVTTIDRPFKPRGGIAILRGNLAP